MGVATTQAVEQPRIWATEETFSLACVSTWGFLPKFPRDCSHTPHFLTWEEPALGP